ncbi:MAG: hypothetical protein HY092_02955 [Candidatus Kerfeldbacteria bacterium]|nr:hypothetical protein [Candidatus Kerfeldbacteria bacterium]
MSFFTKQNLFRFSVGTIGTVALIVFAIRMTTPHRGLTDQSGDRSTVHVALAATYASIPTEGGKAAFKLQSNGLNDAVDPELTDLDKQIITCSPDVDALLTSAPSTGPSCSGGSTTLKSVDGMYLSGQCCNAMTNLDHYHEELKNLQPYKDIPDVPLNPFKTPVPIAKKWIDYDQATTLTAEEQKVYDQAMDMSKEKPCCCKCWHYFVNEGIGKKMIRDYHYTAQQVAGYWDNSDICGT